MVEKIEKLIDQREISRSSIDDLAGLPAGTLSNILRSDRVPRVDNAMAIAKALGVPLDWLVDDDAPWPPPERGYPHVGRLLSEQARARFEELAERHGGFEVCLTAAIEAFTELDEKSQALPLFKAQRQVHDAGRSSPVKFDQDVAADSEVLGESNGGGPRGGARRERPANRDQKARRRGRSK